MIMIMICLLQGLTLLHLACMKRLTQSVKVLLASGVGCNPNTDVCISWLSMRYNVCIGYSIC